MRANVFVSTTVLLESEWVLRSAYGLAAKEIAMALRAFAGLPGVFRGEARPDRRSPRPRGEWHGLRRCATSRHRGAMRGHADVRPAVHRTGQGCVCHGDRTLRAILTAVAHERRSICRTQSHRPACRAAVPQGQSFSSTELRCPFRQYANRHRGQTCLIHCQTAFNIDGVDASLSTASQCAKVVA